MAGAFCSFRCNALETDFQRKLGATFNEWGLLEDEDVARRCAEYAGRPETPTCSPVWHPWMVLSAIKK
jgi:NADH:ubiquinone oxidoreductase subunit